ncbi:MAG: YkgJ family cysteine cluster protein [Cyanobacteria bacterium P01_H01_bin.74]
MYDLNYYGTGSDDDKKLEPLPDLCHKSGRCCKSATTFHSQKKLMEMAENGEKEAIDFLSVFKPYKSIEDAREVVPEQVKQVLEVVEKRKDMSVEDLTFYYCEHVSPEGVCTIYERRPRCCREAPNNGWSAMPPGCGFEGWQFEQREKQRRLVRDMKRSVYALEQLSPDGVHHPIRPDTKLEDLNQLMEERLKPWLQFGAANW